MITPKGILKYLRINRDWMILRAISAIYLVHRWKCSTTMNRENRRGLPPGLRRLVFRRVLIQMTNLSSKELLKAFWMTWMLVMRQKEGKLNMYLLKRRKDRWKNWNYLHHSLLRDNQMNRIYRKRKKDLDYYRN